MRDLQQLGFEPCGWPGEIIAENCRVTFYRVMGEWEIDVVTPNGSVVWFNVPIRAVNGLTAADIRERRAGEAKIRAILAAEAKEGTSKADGLATPIAVKAVAPDSEADDVPF
jgi:hypothetical protein